MISPAAIPPLWGYPLPPPWGCPPDVQSVMVAITFRKTMKAKISKDIAPVPIGNQIRMY